jgi:hypothetical protein
VTEVLLHPLRILLIEDDLKDAELIQDLLETEGIACRPYRVAEVREEPGDYHMLVMQPEGYPGFRFIPGQFGWLPVWESSVRGQRPPIRLLLQRRHPDVSSLRTLPLSGRGIGR